MLLGAKRLGYGGETTRVENRGETTRGGGDDLLPANHTVPFLFHCSLWQKQNSSAKTWEKRESETKWNSNAKTEHYGYGNK